jgi:hypothetical protein
MPKRVIDFDAMWGSDKIAACAEWAQAEYAWLYGLADPSGCFEVTNLRVIWGRVAAIRQNLTIERLEQIFDEFQDKGLLFVWEQDGKRYGHWTGSDVPGRLPPPSWRMRLERLAPPVPKRQLEEYVSRFARGRAASPGGGFLTEARREEENLKFEISNLKKGGPKDSCGEIKESRSGLKGRVEEGQGQGLDLGLDWEGNGERGGVHGGAVAEHAACGEADRSQNLFSELNSKANANSTQNSKSYSNSNSESNSNSNALLDFNANANSDSSDRTMANAESSLPAALIANANERGRLIASANGSAVASANARTDAACLNMGIEDGEPVVTGMKSSTMGRAGGKWGANAGRNFAPAVVYRDKAELLARELRVGEGPSSCGPVRVKPEALERNRRRNAARDGSRSP